jgi:hypothetical protein
MTGKIKQVQKFFDKCVYKQKVKHDFRSQYDPLFLAIKMQTQEEANELISISLNEFKQALYAKRVKTAK